MPTRDSQWRQLSADPYDVCVVGGGITGAGIARDAARRGLRTVLLEANDLAFGTSSRSSKLVHGGLRYLEQYEFSLVFEAVSERRILMDVAPHLVNPLGFLFPVSHKSRHGLWKLNAGMWLYDGLSLFRSPKLHRTLKPADVKREEPALGLAGLTGAPLYYDCATDDARLTLETALDAVGAGATVATGARVDRFVVEKGRVRAAVVHDVWSGEEKEVRAHAIVNATGPWTDHTLGLAGRPPAAPLLRPTKGVHIVVHRETLPMNHAVVATHPTDGRVLFAIPWGEQTYIGTTDTDEHVDPAEVHATRADVDYLIDAARAYFPAHVITHADVVATWAGLRPLIAPPSGEGVAESRVSREHRIVVGEDGLVTIAGGKLTTYRRMAAEVVDTAVDLLRLQGKAPETLGPARTEEPLPGAVGWPADDDHDAVGRTVARASKGHLDGRTSRYLADTYGMRAVEIARRVAADPSLARPLVTDTPRFRPEIVGQVDWAVREELAATVADVLVRRTQVYFRDDRQGLGAAPKVARRMAELLGWDEAREASEIAAYGTEVDRSRRWRDEDEGPTVP